MFEGCNTGFQVHLQIDPGEAVSLYNLAQAISAPVLACATNSPVLLGKRLWNETRIALFQQAVDTRQSSQTARQKSARVTFGTEWVKDSILEIFHDNVARFRVILGPQYKEDSLRSLERCNIPQLRALQLFNTTVWRWNRLCYGILGGQPHLRIENRILPSGPTVRDEIANTAFWIGLMYGMPELYSDVTRFMEFDDAKDNFIKAARIGLDTKLKWMNGSRVPADELILSELLLVSRSGLRNAGIIDDDADLYLGIIEERVRTGKTGSKWVLDSYSALRKEAKDQEALLAVTAGMIKRQKKGEPVHMWNKAELEEAGSWYERCEFIDQVMSTDLFVVQQDDLIDLAAGIMGWKHIRHVPVEDENGNFAGLLTSGILLSFYGSKFEEDAKPVYVRDIMIKDPLTVSPETKTLDAISVMYENKAGCLPVVKANRLVGIVTEHDFMNLSAFLLKEHVDFNRDSD
jgi:CBS domain-containing protein